MSLAVLNNHYRESDTDWIIGRSDDTIARQIASNQRHQFNNNTFNNYFNFSRNSHSRFNKMNFSNNNNNNYDNENGNDYQSNISKKLINRPIEFVKPSNPENARPSTTSSHSSHTSSTSSSKISVVRGHQRSEFNFPKRHLFEESEIQKMMKWPRNLTNSRGGGLGLRNLGNSCFMNASLQCMCYTAPLQNYLATRQHGAKCRLRGFCIFCELETLFPGMIGNSGGSCVPRNVFSNLQQLSRSLRPGRQEDAHEFITNFLDGLQTCSLKTESEKIKDPRIQETSVIHKIFGGYLRSQVKCCKCGNESNTYDAILDLSLEIKGCSSVNSALKHYTSDEILHGDNKYFCNRCKKKRKAHKKLSIFEAPNVLVLHLKRFEFGTGMAMGGFMGRGTFSYGGYRGGFGGGREGKIDKHVDFDETLDITHLQSYHTSPRVSYSLYGVLIHHGRSPNSGHYTSYIKAPNGDWFYMDDSSVSRANINEVLRSSAYILFYTRNETKIPYKSPAMTPNAHNANLLNHGKKFDLDSIRNVLPNETPAIFELEKQAIANNETNRLRSIRASLTNDDTQKAGILSNTERNKSKRDKSNDTQNNENMSDSGRVGSVVKFAHVHAAAPDSIDSKILSMKPNLKRSNKSVIVSEENEDNEDNYNDNNGNEEPPFKKRRIWGNSNNKSVNMSECEIKTDSNESESESGSISRRKWKFSSKAKKKIGAFLRGKNMNPKIDTMNNKGFKILKLKQRQSQVLLNLKQKLRDEQSVNANVKKVTNKNEIEDARVNQNCPKSANTNNKTDTDAQKNIAKPKPKQEQEQEQEQEQVRIQAHTQLETETKNQKKNRKRNKNKNKNKNNKNENQNINANENNFGNIVKDGVVKNDNKNIKNNDKISGNWTNTNANESTVSRSQSESQSRLHHSESNESDTGESILSVLSSRSFNGNQTSSGTSSPNAFAPLRAPNKLHSERQREREQTNILDDNDSNKLFDVNSNDCVSQKMKNSLGKSVNVNVNENNIKNERTNKRLNELSQPLGASKKEVFSYLLGNDGNENKSNNTPKSNIFGKSVSTWNDSNNSLILDRNEMVSKLNKNETSFIGSKDKWEAEIDYERTKSTNGKKKKKMKTKWKEFNKFSNKKGFDKVQSGEWTKNKRGFRAKKHKKIVNYRKHSKRERKVN